MRASLIVLITCLAAPVGAAGQSFSTIFTFDLTNGAAPQGLIQATDGNFYGVTSGGGLMLSRCNGNSGCGTVFKITPEGSLTTVYEFCSEADCTDGENPAGTLLQGNDGNFYGVTVENGNISYGNFAGTLFKLTPSGVLTTLHSFTGPDGAAPNGGLVQDYSGNLYGTTESGGPKGKCGSGEACGAGTIFRITPTGEFTTLYKFCSQTNCADGTNPFGGLVLATDGELYGTTIGGGTGAACEGGCGTVFKLWPGGSGFTVLHSFDGPDGINPEAALTQDNDDGNFYGTTAVGGTSDSGTLFRMAPDGQLVALASFPNGNFPSNIRSPLVQGTNGNFYGAAVTGTDGFNEKGNLFESTPFGVLRTLYDFATGALSSSMSPDGVLQATSGTFFGTTEGGLLCESCNFVYGTVFSFNRGLGPFVALQRNAGEAGQTVVMLGQGLTDTTAVSFNGVEAAFTVESDTYLKATVPSAVTTGFVTVTTPSTTLNSNQEFRVLPQITSFTPTDGPPGTTMVITGKSLTQATAVSLACKWPMTFTVNSDTQITATIPEDGTTGGIGIQTRGGHVESTGNFTVTQ